jgi:hypothetical protein
MSPSQREAVIRPAGESRVFLRSPPWFSKPLRLMDISKSELWINGGTRSLKINDSAEVKNESF